MSGLMRVPFLKLFRLINAWPVLAALLIAGFLGGCSSQEIKVEPAPLPKKGKSFVETDVLWRNRVGVGAGNRYLNFRPVATDRAIYMVDAEGLIVAFDINSGKRLWRIRTGEAISSGLTEYEGRIWYGTFSGDLVCLRAETGEEVWRRALSSEILAPVTVDGSLLIAQTGDGKVVGLSEANGRRHWVFESTVPPLSLRGTSRPQAVAGAVVAAFASGKLVALNRETGLPIWDRQIAVPEGRLELEQMVDIDADFVVADNVIYVTTYQGRIAALDLYSGVVIWQREMSSFAGIALDAESLYVSDEEGKLWALNRSTGSVRWKQEQLLARSLSAPQEYKGYVVVGDFEGYLHWIASDSGSYMGRVRLDRKGLRVQPFEQQGDLFVSGVGGQLARLELEE